MLFDFINNQKIKGLQYSKVVNLQGSPDNCANEELNIILMQITNMILTLIYTKDKDIEFTKYCILKDFK